MFLTIMSFLRKFYYNAPKCQHAYIRRGGKIITGEIKKYISYYVYKKFRMQI